MKRISRKKVFVLYKDKKRAGFKFGIPTAIGTVSLTVSLFVAVTGWKQLATKTSANTANGSQNVLSTDLDIRSNPEQVVPEQQIVNPESPETIPEMTDGDQVVEEQQDQDTTPVQVVSTSPQAQYNPPAPTPQQNNDMAVANPDPEPVVVELPKNNPPVITTQPSTSSVYLGNTFSYQVLASDQDNEPLSFSFSATEFDVYNDSRINSSSLLGSNLLIFSPNASDKGKTFNFMVIVSDGKENTVQQFSVTVLDPGKKLTIISPQSSQVFQVNEIVFFSGTVKYLGIDVGWADESYVWTIKKDGVFLGTMFGLNASYSFQESGNYTILFTAVDPETSESTSSSVSIVVS